MRQSRSQFFVVYSVFSLNICTGLPLMNMDDNLTKNHPSISAGNSSTDEIISSHQELDPVRVPDTASVGAAADHPVTPDQPPVSSFPELPKAMQSTPELNVTHTQDATVILPEVPNVQRPNATQLDKLMTDLHMPLPDPNSNVIQHKTDSSDVPPNRPLGRDLLPSIVASGNKELSPNPAGSPGVPPAAVEQQNGDSLKQLIPNPFGTNPAVIAVDVPPAVPVQPVKRVLS